MGAQQVSGSLPAKVGDEPARVLDISYGGLRLELERKPERPVPTSFTLDFPSSGLSVPVDVVLDPRASARSTGCAGRASSRPRTRPHAHGTGSWTPSPD